ncbi:MAG TPA: hypothetical protein VIL74_25860 [Pyrinomonadaceae bacterium]
MEKSHNETEILGADERKLREMCRSLKKVDAPANFDLKVRARLAAAKSSEPAPRFGFALRYALPAFALILVFGLLAYNGGFLSPDGNPTIARSTAPPSIPAAPQSAPVSNFAPQENVEQPNETVAPATEPESPKTNGKPQLAARIVRVSKKDLPKAKNESGGGSTVYSWKEAKSLTLPNVNANPVAPKSSGDKTGNPVSVKELLTENGIDADFENGRWSVKSVRANSAGADSGVREKDVIEAIDGQPLGGETILNKPVKSKTITVIRNGEKTQIDLRARQ